MTDKVTYRSTIKSDLDGVDMLGESIKGITILKNNVVAVVVGLSQGYPAQLFGYFLVGDEEKIKYKRLIVIIGRKLKEMMEEAGVPIIARADKCFTGAENYLKWLGFIKKEDGYFMWEKN